MVPSDSRTGQENLFSGLCSLAHTHTTAMVSNGQDGGWTAMLTSGSMETVDI